MWICLNDAFFSIVHKECGPDELLVRARRPGDIERVFPGADVKKSTSTDYLFRAVVPRADVADALMTMAMTVDYSNFKNSVGDRRLHDAYSGFWGIHARLQPTAPYSGRRQGRGGLF
jgi:hypothetical protein